MVPASWLERKIREPRGRSPFSGDLYGYGWFLTRVDGAQAAYGRGYGGQMLLVVPERGLSVAITSDPTQPARSGGYFGDLRDLAAQIVTGICLAAPTPARLAAAGVEADLGQGDDGLEFREGSVLCGIALAATKCS